MYALIVAFLRLVTRIFFRTVEVVGTEHVPAGGPVIFVGNHPNSLIDPVMILTTCGRRVSFAAKDTLFASPFLRPFLAATGAVPIKRKMDHAAGPLDNTAAFDALFAVLEQGGAFGIFPEGISHTSSELAPLKTGAARIALGAAEKGIPVRIVPSGLIYKKRERMRGRVLVQFGKPLDIDAAELAAWKEDPRAAAQALTTRIDHALRLQTVNAPDFETLRVLDGARRLYEPSTLRLSLAEQGEVVRRFVDHWQRLRDEPEVAALYRDVEVYLQELRVLGVNDPLLERGVSRMQWLGRIVRHLFLVLVLAPFALPGIVLHAPVLLGAVVAGDGLTDRKDVVATVKMITAAVMVLVAYLAAGALVFFLLDFPYDVIFAPLTIVALLVSGWATIRVLEQQTVLRRAIWVFGHLLYLKRDLLRLRRERDALRARLLDMVDKHLDPSLPRIVDPALQRTA